jgi:hypothetical protein
MADKGHKPTSGMKSAAQRALNWHKEGKRGGTSVGFARANQIVSGESLSDDTVKRMYSFFSRHEVDKKATGFNSGEEGYPSPGRVAWDLWGGDSGFAFARSKVKHTIKKMIEEELTDVIQKSDKKVKVGQMVSWGSSGGNAKGKVVKIKRNGSINVPNSSFTISGTEESPAVLIRVYKDGKPTDTLVGHKMETLRVISSTEKAIGTTSSVNEEEFNDSHVEYYIREEGENKIMTDKTTTEPDPTGEIAVTKSANSDLARRKIQKAMKALEKAMASLPDANRASEVSVDNATAPTEKAAGLPDVSRAGDVNVSNETAPVAKAQAPMQGTDQPVAGEGENSEPGNATVEPLHKAAGTCAECGDSCGDDETKCYKCMSKDITSGDTSDTASADIVKSEDGDDKEPDEDEDDEIKKADSCADCGKSNADCTCKMYKSAQDLVNEAKMTKSVWGGAFGAPNIPNIR